MFWFYYMSLKQKIVLFVSWVFFIIFSVFLIVGDLWYIPLVAISVFFLFYYVFLNPVEWNAKKYNIVYKTLLRVRWIIITILGVIMIYTIISLLRGVDKNRAATKKLQEYEKIRYEFREWVLYVANDPKRLICPTKWIATWFVQWCEAALKEANAWYSEWLKDFKGFVSLRACDEPYKSMKYNCIYWREYIRWCYTIVNANQNELEHGMINTWDLKRDVLNYKWNNCFSWKWEAFADLLVENTYPKKDREDFR